MICLNLTDTLLYNGSFSASFSAGHSTNQLCLCKLFPSSSMPKTPFSSLPPSQMSIPYPTGYPWWSLLFTSDNNDGEREAPWKYNPRKYISTKTEERFVGGWMDWMVVTQRRDEYNLNWLLGTEITILSQPRILVLVVVATRTTATTSTKTERTGIGVSLATA